MKMIHRRNLSSKIFLLFSSSVASEWGGPGDYLSYTALGFSLLLLGSSLAIGGKWSKWSCSDLRVKCLLPLLLMLRLLLLILLARPSSPRLASGIPFIRPCILCWAAAALVLATLPPPPSLPFLPSPTSSATAHWVTRFCTARLQVGVVVVSFR